MKLHQIYKVQSMRELCRNSNVHLKLSPCRRINNVTWKYPVMQHNAYGTLNFKPIIPWKSWNKDIRFMSAIPKPVIDKVPTTTIDLQKCKEEIKNAETVDSVLNVWKVNEQSIIIISSICLKISEMIKEHPNLKEEILSNAQFEEFRESIHTSMKHLNRWTCTTVLSLYTELESTDSKYIEGLLHLIRNKITFERYSNLCKYKEIFKNHQETEIRKEFLDAVIKQLNMRWQFGDLCSTADIISMMYEVYDPKGKIMQHQVKKMKFLQDAASKKLSEMSAEELYQVLYCLSKQKQTRSPLTGKVCGELVQKDFNFSMVKLLNLLYSCYMLLRTDTELLSKISMNVLSQLEQENRSHILASLMKAFSELHWSVEDLNYLLLTKWLQLKGNNIESSQDINELYIVFNSLKIANQLPNHHALKDLNKFLDPLKKAYYENQPYKWLQSVYTAGVVGKLTAEMAESVLQPHFVKTISERTYFKLHSSKLLMVNACAVCDLVNYTGPRLDEEFIRTNAQKIRSQKYQKVLDTVESILAKMTPSSSYIQTDTHTSLGHVIDFELQVNDKLEFQPFGDHPDRSLQRIAIVLLPRNSYVSYANKPSGRVLTMKRHIRDLGYLYIGINIRMFKQLKDEQNRVQFLKDTIESAHKHQKRK